MPPRRLEPPYHFFVDECFGRKIVPDAMRGALEPGEKLTCWFELFDAGTEDEVWLPKVGGAGMAIITRDVNLRFRPNERNALIDASAAVFMATSSTGDKMATVLVSAMPTMRRALNRKLPLIGRVLDNGDIVLRMVDGEECDKRVKRPKQ